MGSVKLSPGRSFAPFYGWTRQDYDEALRRDWVVPAPEDTPRLPAGPVAALLEAVGPTLPWQADALCREYPGVDWFADRTQDAAKAVCSRCLVRAECRIAGDHEHGVWGATTTRERTRLRRTQVA